jgi:hypothetical protein
MISDLALEFTTRFEKIKMSSSAFGYRAFIVHSLFDRDRYIEDVYMVREVYIPSFCNHLRMFKAFR